jgi:hypothetical protein
MAGIEKFLAKRLKLKVNKSAVAKPNVRKFLGFSFTSGESHGDGLRRKRSPASKQGSAN